jgi:hypothetical protein
MVIRRLKARLRKWKSDRFLKKHGCSYWWQYNKRYDTDYKGHATRIEDVYHGYPYVHCFVDRKHYAYEILYDYGPGGYRDGIHDIMEWCSKNCDDKFRFDYQRVLQTHDGKWETNEIAGGDYLFATFKDEKDYLLFLLRWA